MSKSPTLSIPECSASQVLGDQVVPLATGTLSVYAEELPNNDLAIAVGPNVAFSILASTTTFFTHTDDPCLYFFSLPIGTDKVGSGHYVKLTLPETIKTEGSEEEKLRDAFEEILIERGYLKGGIEARGEDVVHRIHDDATALSNNVQAQGKLMPTANTYAQRATTTVAQFGVAVGEKVVGLFGGSQVVEDIAKDGPEQHDASLDPTTRAHHSEAPPTVGLSTLNRAGTKEMPPHKEGLGEFVEESL